ADPADSRWRMLDRYATRIVRYESDKIWTQALGHRTPFGELGSFPDSQQDQPQVEEGLLDDLLGD
ncbi:MAG: hypothetical protein KDK70_41810, partial [Myxococcales bacterium]|nr:hypothetical protein [Myxococcales bacterium]